MKATKIILITSCIALLIIQIPNSVLAQESRQAPTELSREINQINLLIEEYNNIQGFYQNELRSQIDQLAELNHAINSESRDSEKHQNLKIQYKHVYASALRSRIDQLNKLDSLINNIEGGIERAMNVGFETENAGAIIENAIQTVNQMRDQIEEENLRAVILADHLVDISPAKKRELEAKLFNNQTNVEHINTEQGRLQALQENAVNSPDAESNLFLRIRAIKQSVRSTSTRIQATLARLDAVRSILLTNTELSIELNNVNEMVASYNKMVESISGIMDVSDFMDDDLPVPTGILFPPVSIETLDNQPSNVNENRINRNEIRENATRRFITETEN